MTQLLFDLDIRPLIMASRANHKSGPQFAKVWYQVKFNFQNFIFNLPESCIWWAHAALLLSTILLQCSYHVKFSFENFIFKLHTWNSPESCIWWAFLTFFITVKYSFWACKKKKKQNSNYSQIWGQSYTSFKALGRCKIKCLNWWMFAPLRKKELYEYFRS